MPPFGLSPAVVDEIRSVFKSRGNIRKVLLFGSRAKGEFSEGSDIDLALVGDEKFSARELSEIALRLDDLGLLYKIDLVDRARVAGTPLGEHIARVGKIFYVGG